MIKKLVICKVCRKEKDVNVCWTIHSQGHKTYECIVKCNLPPPPKPKVIAPLEIDIPDSYIVENAVEDWGVQLNPTNIINSIRSFFTGSTQYSRLKQD